MSNHQVTELYKHNKPAGESSSFWVDCRTAQVPQVCVSVVIKGIVSIKHKVTFTTQYQFIYNWEDIFTLTVPTSSITIALSATTATSTTQGDDFA